MSTHVHNWSGFPGPYCLECGAEPEPLDSKDLIPEDIRPGLTFRRVGRPEHVITVERVVWRALPSSVRPNREPYARCTGGYEPTLDALCNRAWWELVPAAVNGGSNGT